MNIKSAKKKIKEDFYDDLMTELSKYPFGSMPKRDLECLLFYLLNKHDLIEGKCNRDKSYCLGLTSARLNSFYIDSNAKFGKKGNEVESVMKILEKLKNETDVSYEDGYFIFSEENPVLREDFIQAMKDKGFYTDTSHNKEIIKVKAIALLAFLTGSSDVSVINDLVQRTEFNNQILKKYFLNHKNWNDIAGDLLDIFRNSDKDAVSILSNAAFYCFDLLKASLTSTNKI